MDHDPHMPRPAKSPFMGKLAVYLTGVAIGFLLLGWFQYQKSNAARAQRARQQAEPQAEPANGPQAEQPGQPSPAGNPAP